MNRASIAALLLPGLVFTAGTSVAGEKPSLGPGTLVRVTAPGVSGKRLTGRLGESTEREIVLLLSSSERIVIPSSAVERLEWSRGRKGHALTGSLVGAAFGCAAIVALSRMLCEASECEGPGAGAYLVGAGIGALPGAGIGALIKTHDWKDAPAATVRLAVAPVPKGVGMNVTLRF